MGIQINLLCNMSMKFAALLLFVGVTNAGYWCEHPVGSLTCRNAQGVEVESGHVTAYCCQGEPSDSFNWELGCTSVKNQAQLDELTECCESYGCTGASTIA